MKVPSAKKSHYYILSAMIIFVMEGDESGNPRSHMLNTMIKSPDPHINLERLGRAQQAVQLRMAEILGEDAPKSTVVDVVIMSISPLGYMSDKEFNARTQAAMPQPETTT